MQKEALEDGIRFAESKQKYGTTRYYIPCHICGAEVHSINYVRGHKYTCAVCKLENKISKDEERHEEKIKRFENAVIRISKKIKNTKQYEPAIDRVAKNLFQKGWFESTEEIMTAIELIKNGYKISHQKKFGRYKADFVIPELKTVLEIDGKPYHPESITRYETSRDNYINFCLGLEWEIIRIDTELINQNITRLVPAIKKVREKRLLLRSKNNGLLPSWYTPRKL